MKKRGRKRSVGRIVTGILLILLVAAGASIFYRAQVGRFTWKHLHSARLALLLDPDDAVLTRDIGAYNFSKARYDLKTAKKYFIRALAIDAHVPYAHFELGRIAFINGELSTAVKEADNEIAVNPDFPNSYYLRALAHAYADDLPGAIRDFKTFLTKKPESWAGHNDLAWIYFRAGDFNGSALAASEGLISAPHNPWLENTLGTALLNLGRYKEAETHLVAAQDGFKAMTPAGWGTAYPGNDSRVYEQGLAASRKSVADNLALVRKKLQTP